jgi:hypothetical protein
VTFVNETDATVNSYEDDSESEAPNQASENGPTGSPCSSSTQLLQSESPRSPIRHRPSWTLENTPRPISVSSLEQADSAFIGPMPQPSILPTLPSSTQDFIQLPSPSSPSYGRVSENDIASLSRQPTQPTFENILQSAPLPSIYLETPVWPLKDPAEALLLRHYVQNLAIWVGRYDPIIQMRLLILQVGPLRSHATLSSGGSSTSRNMSHPP